MTFEEILADSCAFFARPQDNRTAEIYLDLPASNIQEASASLRAAGCRHVAIFAEDRVAEESRYYVYYVFEHPQDRRYLLLRTPISPSQPEFH